MGQLLFGRYMIIPIKHKVDWELISQLNQNKTNKYNIRKIIIDLTKTIKLEIKS